MKTISQISYSLYQTMMEKLPTAVLLLDHDFNYIYSNPSFLLFSELNSCQIAIKDWSLCLQSNDKEALFQLLSEIKNSGMLCTDKSLRIFKNQDSKLCTNITVTPIHHPTHACVYMLTFIAQNKQESGFEWIVQNRGTNEFVLNPVINQNREIIFKDINKKATDKKKYRNEAITNEYIADLKASNQLKDKVLAIISHDMRSPISSLKGLSADFFDEELTIEDRGFVRKSLLKQLDAVSDLTENLLRWAALSFIKKDFVESEILDLFKIVEQNIELINHHSISKNIQIYNNIPKQTMTLANKDQIHIVIRNLISNAVKYTPVNGRINISGIDLVSHLQIRISDTGIGITKEQLGKLFTYSHSNTYGTSGEKGIGLGLLLCKEYIEFNGGKISVLSEVNIGTTVVVELPNSGIENNFNSYSEIPVLEKS